jgi:hypothetical protein
MADGILLHVCISAKKGIAKHEVHVTLYKTIGGAGLERRFNSP